MFFDEILGQEYLKQMIQSSLYKNNFPQSKIIVDKDGYGGLLFALAISERLLLEKGLKNSDVLNHPDLNFVFPLFSSKDVASELNKEWLSYISDNKFPNIVGWMSASNSSGSQGSIRVKEVESMYRSASLKSFYGKKKVFIIWGGELLITQAANKLLKILEEPPADCYFIIITRDINEILPTIKSRCQISSLSPALPELIEEKIKALGIELPEPPTPAGSYIPVVKTGNLLFISGQIPMENGKVLFTGKVSDENIETAQKSARMCAINILAQIKRETGNFEKVSRIVKLSGFVNSTSEFTQHPKVINAASDLFFEI